MNRVKKIFINVFAMLMAVVCAFSFSGCSSSIVDAELDIKIYDFTEAEMDDYSLDIDIYSNLAPKTAAAIISYIKEGYYNNTVFYKLSDSKSQIMIGDLKYDESIVENEGFYLNTEKPMLEGEFKKGGTIGSDLKNVRGSIGLWRTWSAQDYSFNMGSTGTDTGRATWYLPTGNLTSYDDYFCVFAKYDITDSSNVKAINALEKAFSSSSNYEEFVIYYTGTYGNLQFHCVKKADFKESEIEDLFKAKENSEQLVCYNHYTILVPMTEDGEIAARIVKAEIDK